MKKTTLKRIAAVAVAALCGITTIACGQPAAQPESEAVVAAAEESAADGVQTEAVESEAAPAEDLPPLQMATKPITEQYILGELLKQVIESYTPYTVEITKGIGGGTSNIMPAMESGEFDLYPEYTSTGYVLVLEHDAAGVADEDMWTQLREEYNEKYDMSWVGELGFNNTYAVVVRKDTAEEYNLKTTSDLAAVADQLVFGGNPDYIERPDGLQKVCDTYGLEFKSVKDIDIGLKYEALNNHDIDVTNGYTTDAQLGTGNFVALEDDLHLQVNYFCSTIVRNDALASRPMLEEAILMLNNVLDDAQMAQLNAQVELEGRDEAEVAKEFLITHEIITE